MSTVCTCGDLYKTESALDCLLRRNRDEMSAREEKQLSAVSHPMDFKEQEKRLVGFFISRQLQQIRDAPEGTPGTK